MNRMTKHSIFLDQALQLAQQRRGFCAPNPAVGAVLVKNNQIIATSTHWAAGHPHAEQVLLEQVGAAVRDTTLYVTLEPCCHWGKTPPCTDLLIAAGIKEVYFAATDPNPAVAGKGALALRNAGIICESIDHSAINAFYQSYYFWRQHQRPYVTAKLAMSLDGKIAGNQGQPIAITGKELQKFTHSCRQNADAILTTAKTIIQDDPSLNIRFNDQVIGKPLYILDSELRLPLTAKIWRTATAITLFHGPNVMPQRLNALKAQGARCIAVAKTDNGLALANVLDKIGADGIHDLWVEAGGRCFQALCEEKLVQQGLIYIAPRWLGADAQSAFSNKIEVLLQSATSIQWQNCGQDVISKISWHDLERRN